MTVGETPMRTRLYSTRDVAQKLGVRRYRLDYLLETGRIPEPSLRIAGKRIWSADELEAAASVLTDQAGSTTGNGSEAREDAGQEAGPQSSRLREHGSRTNEERADGEGRGRKG